jgi:S1-C subfamily serine protease
VLAVENPLGFSGSVTDGIISATGRTVSEPAATLPDVVQTSAAINPGNSGGALVDLTGQVVGIPTLAALDAQTLWRRGAARRRAPGSRSRPTWSPTSPDR